MLAAAVGAVTALTADLLFQSSPAPRGGCWPTGDAMHHTDTTRRFNPHPPRGAGAGSCSAGWLTAMASVFQSSPAPRGGCWLVRGAPRSHGGNHEVSILTRPEGRVLARGATRRRRRAAWCFNPHPPRGAGAGRPPSGHRPQAARVSILTRPEGRVLAPFGDAGAFVRPYLVSILTRPEGRVLATPAPSTAAWCWAFQSSPAPRGGCWKRAPRGRRGGVPDVSILTRPEGRVLARIITSHCRQHTPFQSSPAPRGGCWMDGMLEATV